MSRLIKLSLIVLTSLSLASCSNSKSKETGISSTETTEKVVKKKTEETSSSSSEKQTEITTSEKTVETEAVEIVQEKIQETPLQQVSDMPPSWYGTQQEWEEAKTQGWTAEGYEEQVRASENESGPIQPGDPNYVWPYADEQRNEFFNSFYAEHGREPTSGEIQSAWAKEQGWE